MPARSNAEWLDALTCSDERQRETLTDLRAALERAAFFHARRRLGGVQGVGADEIQALAEDAAQDAIVLVLDKLETFRGEARFLTWAASFAILKTATALQRKLWSDVSLDHLPDGWREPVNSAMSVSGWANPQVALQRQSIWEVIKEVVETELTDRQREALNLVVIHGVRTEKVEEILGVTPSALYKMTHDARRKLKAGLLKRGYSIGEILSAFSAKG